MISKELDEVTAKVESEFGELDVTLLNLRPAPDKWSIAQCLDHLIVSNETYFASFDLVLSGLNKHTFWQKINFLAGFAGRNAVKALKSRKIKFKAPSVFMPDRGNVRADIVDHFVMHQEELKQYFDQLEEANLYNEIINSPAVKAVTVKVGDLMKVIVEHERRHLDQAMRVKKEYIDS